MYNAYEYDFPTCNVDLCLVVIRKSISTYIPSGRIEFPWVWINFRVQMNAPKPDKNFPTLGNGIT